MVAGPQQFVDFRDDRSLLGGTKSEARWLWSHQIMSAGSLPTFLLPRSFKKLTVIMSPLIRSSLQRR
jgi:hypothetical protein